MPIFLPLYQTYCATDVTVLFPIGDAAARAPSGREGLKSESHEGGVRFGVGGVYCAERGLDGGEAGVVAGVDAASFGEYTKTFDEVQVGREVGGR